MGLNRPRPSRSRPVPNHVGHQPSNKVDRNVKPQVDINDVDDAIENRSGEKIDRPVLDDGCPPSSNRVVLVEGHTSCEDAWEYLPHMEMTDHEMRQRFS